MILSAVALLAAQASSALSPAEQARLTLCLDQARTDPASAVVNAGQWLAELGGGSQALPQQCLGQAYVSLLRWEAAEQAFLAGRNAAPDDSMRARLGAMAGNAALAGGRWEAALAMLAVAQVDAAAAGATALAGSIAADRARALVGLGRIAEARQALDRARSEDPQNAEAWLLSATLARREGDLATAAGMISTAAALAPDDPQVALEAGVIAVMLGDDEAARGNWELVQDIAPNGPEAATATGYLAQLDGLGE
jgi:Flp pilus assembly protein TadD